jgi:hypothetical protein
MWTMALAPIIVEIIANKAFLSAIRRLGKG